MPPQVLTRNWKMNKSNFTHVERTTPLHKKKKSIHSKIVFKLIAIYVLLEKNSANGG